MTFLGIQESYEKAKVVIQPFPVEETTSYGKGTKNGPEAIIKASQELEHYDIESQKQPVQTHTLEPTTKVSIKKPLEDNKFIVSLGGEHSISYPIVKEFKEKYSNLTVLQIDAHADLRGEFEGNKLSHACVMRRISEICPFVGVGIRSMSKEEADFIKEGNLKVFGMDFDKEKVLDSLSENVYITLDVDAFDPSVIPSTGTPEPGGFTWNQMLELLKQIFKNKNVVGFDIVEFSPIENLHAPDYTIAKLLYKLIEVKFNEK